MSYLNNLRLTFSGDFQADVSTVNNDVRHYDNATFKARFQDFQTQQNANGWWNPIGSGAFRLINCRVQSVAYQDGTTTDNPSVDSAVGLFISGSNDRVGAKIVDLDPQWQLASQLWGLQIRLTQADGNSPLTSSFEPAAFRDLWFTRGAASGDSGASAIFQSVLANLSWDQNLLARLDSRFLEELKAASTNGLLSIRLTTFGYNTHRLSNRFTVGTVSGVIGPYQAPEPRSFVLGRRMVPLNGDATCSRITFFDCQVDSDTCTVFADLSNALPLNQEGKLQDIGTLQLAMLCSETTLENNLVSNYRKGREDFIALGTPIPYQTDDWLLQTGGIWAVKFPRKLLDSLNQHPLALIKLSDRRKGMVAIRESEKGWFVRADQFVHRVESGSPAQTTLFAAQYGSPLANATIDIALQSPNKGTADAPHSADPPKAPVYDINTPDTAVRYSQTLIADASTGTASLEVQTSNPGNPRHYIDGQLYIFEYKLQGQTLRQLQQYDRVFLHLYDPYPIPDQPTWVDHIQPIMQQYSNLYPIMSQQLFDLGNYEAVKQHRAILELAFSLDRSDPNHMPVTRDLSPPRQATILKWLRQKNPDGTYALVYGKGVVPVPVILAAKKRAVAPAVAPLEEIGSKTRASQSFKANLRAAKRS